MSFTFDAENNIIAHADRRPQRKIQRRVTSQPVSCNAVKSNAPV
jgi:hypothetical protein